jgi:SPP1 gp7 family putative phage head morphogenesis protein
MPENINTRLGNTTLRHMSFLTRLENGAIRKLIATMKQAQKDIREIVLVQPFGNLVRGTDDLQALSAGQLRQLDNIQKEIDTVLAVTNRTLTGQLGRELEDFATVEGEMLVSLLNRNIPPSAGLQLQFNRLPIEDIERLVNTPLGGVRFADRINENIRLASGRIKAAMALGMTQNQTIKQISKQVQLVLGDTLINRAETLVRTEMARVANQVNLSAMRQNKEFIDKFIFVSSLDVTVCPICAGLHGEEFPVDHNFMIPVHPRCRCTWMPKLKNAKQLGIDTDSVPDSIKDLFDGKPPDMPLDFDTFLRGQSEKFQLENLGRARFDLFKQGVSVKAMATDTRVLTLAQLRKKVASGVASKV